MTETVLMKTQRRKRKFISEKRGLCQRLLTQKNFNDNLIGIFKKKGSNKFQIIRCLHIMLPYKGFEYLA